MDRTIALAHPTSAEARRRSIRASAAAAVAQALEWYDFFIYATAAALVFNVTFFASGDAVVSALNSFATVAVGFIARPIGGIVAGQLGDKYGRKPVLIGAMLLMALATTLVGFVPSTQIVWLAPTVLVTLRICQGLAVGGQWGGAVLVATESAPANRRGFFGSFAMLGVPLGVILGNVAFLMATGWASSETFLSWGWRVPFWASLIMLPLAYAIHRYLEETPQFEAVNAKLEAGAKAPRSPIFEVIRKNPGTILMAAGANALGIIYFYTTITGSVQFVTTYLGVSRSTVLGVILLANAIMLPAVPFFGWLSDLYGRKMIFGLGTLAMGLWALPMWLLIGSAGPGSIWPFAVAVIVASLCMSMQTGTQGQLFAELFPPQVRYSGASLGYQISAIIGGFAPMAMVALINGAPDNVWRVGAFLAIVAVAGLLCLWVIVRRYSKVDHFAIVGEATVPAQSAGDVEITPEPSVRLAPGRSAQKAR